MNEECVDLFLPIFSKQSNSRIEVRFLNAPQHSLLFFNVNPFKTLLLEIVHEFVESFPRWNQNTNIYRNIS